MTTETPAAAAANTETRGERTVLTGKVTSAKMEKTIVVEVTRLVQHPKYHRVVRITKKFYAHDEQRAAKQGDTVRIVASTVPALMSSCPARAGRRASGSLNPEPSRAGRSNRTSSESIIVAFAVAL